MAPIPPISALKWFEQDDKRKIQVIQDYQIKLLSALFDKATAYANLIIMAGYAGFFGLWSFTKDKLTPMQVFWSALFITISASVFVIFETFKMLWTSDALSSRYNALEKSLKGKSWDETENIYKDYEKRNDSANVKLIRGWKIALWIIILTALIGVFFLIYSFIVNL